MREKDEESSQALGEFVNNQQYHVNERVATYQSKLQRIKELEMQIEKRKAFSEEKWQTHYVTLVRGFSIERANLQSQFQNQLNELEVNIPNRLRKSEKHMKIRTRC